MRYPPSLLDEIRARLPVSQVVGRKVPLKRKGREFAGLSPFKDEKTPSFFVNDQKGFYHCFASGEHGDIFKFLMVTEGLSFPEAVERLAQEAGVALPKPQVADVAREEQRERWGRLLETTTRFFQDALYSAVGRDCLSYLKSRRGLDDATIEAFRIGFAPNSRNALKDHLAKDGFSEREMADMGVLIAGSDIPKPYDRFRNRAMFPICDLGGRVIAFGGRALDPDQPAKYLNSPETPLFHKGRQLYNAHRARKAAYDRGRIVVVEGYMDVVALHLAGVEEAVAPLGTALTEDQIKLLWRFAPEPTLCFDGDSAGRKAAHRAIDTAIHMLAPNASLTFAFLPDGLDPDDLIREGGARAIEDVLSAARPFADILFEREWTSGDWRTPERRAQLETQIGVLVSRIEHQAVRTHYQRDMRDRLYRAFSDLRGAAQSHAGASVQRVAAHPAAKGRRPSGAGQARGPSRRPDGRQGGLSQAPRHSASLRHSALVAGAHGVPPPREMLIVKALLTHPWLIDEHAEDIACIEFASGRLAELRDAILSAHANNISLDTHELHSHVRDAGLSSALDLILNAATHRCDKFAEPDTESIEVETGWRHALRLQKRQSSLRKALDLAEKSWHDDSDEASFIRIRELQRELAALEGTED